MCENIEHGNHEYDFHERVETNTIEPSGRKPIAETETSRQGDENWDAKTQKPYPFSNSKVWHGLPGTLEVVYAQVKGLLHWEELARITRSLNTSLTSRKIIMDQGTGSSYSIREVSRAIIAQW